jgi:hypothetical protein
MAVPLSDRDRRALEPHRVDPYSIVAEDVDELERTIEAAGATELSITDFLADHLALVAAAFMRGNHHQWVLREKRFGDAFRADFLLGEEHSGGIFWKLVEIEPPEATVYSETASAVSEAPASAGSSRSSNGGRSSRSTGTTCASPATSGERRCRGSTRTLRASSWSGGRAAYYRTEERQQWIRDWAERDSNVVIMSHNRMLEQIRRRLPSALAIQEAAARSASGSSEAMEGS